MYKSIHTVRIIISLVAMGVPTWALVAGYNSVFVRMQILTALLGGVAICLIFWAVVTLIYGRIYCSTVCPMGTFMDCVGRVGRIGRRSGPSFRYCAPSNRTRAVFLVITLLTLLVGGTVIPTLLDPYTAYARMVEEFLVRPFGKSAPAVAYAVSTLAVAILTALGVIAFAWKRGRVICNTVCPVGTVLGIGARYSYFHIEIDPDRCTLCGKCEAACKSQCIKLPERTVDMSRCVVCFNCTAACPNDAISYKSGRYRLQMPLIQSVGGNSGKAGVAEASSSAHNLKKSQNETIS